MKWDWLDDYLTFTDLQRKGLIALLVLFACVIGARIWVHYYVKPDIDPRKGELFLEYVREKDEKRLADSLATATLHAERLASKFSFDPNTLDSSGWVSLGLSPKQTVGLLKYRSSGVKFRKPEDLKRSYVISEKFYQSVAAFIKIERQQGGQDYRGKTPARRAQTQKPWTETWANEKAGSNFTRDKIEKTYEIVSLNSADTTALKNLPGIGSFYARMIVKRRAELGGFHNANQLLEVYKMTEENFEKFKIYLDIDPDLINKLNINEADEEMLKKHPYISWRQAKSIVKFREQHGKYTTIYDLTKSARFEKEDVDKLAPYLSTK